MWSSCRVRHIYRHLIMNWPFNCQKPLPPSMVMVRSRRSTRRREYKYFTLRRCLPGNNFPVTSPAGNSLKANKRRPPMAKFLPIIFVHGWGGPGDLVRDFSADDERDPYVGWNTGHRYNDPDNWNKLRNTERNFEGLVLRLVKDFNYYDASND